MDPITPQNASLTWQEDGSPRSTRFDDPYFSAAGGLAEARHVFLAGNNLPKRFRPGFHIAELGFGTGLTALAAWQAWQEADCAGPLRFTSFEAFPLGRADMARAAAHWPELAELAAPFLAQWPPKGVLTLPGLRLEVIYGDARTTLPQWQGLADAWFLDGFSPAKNPELWSPDLLAEVGRHTAKGGSFATYTAAGHVRRALAAAGFTVARIKGFGRKRHMSTGTLPAHITG